ncbi:MAG: 30S ribosomal protein S20 [Nitrospira sp. CG24A]|nr:MAG: 30S ribosomal protein S20 [Nitrospira sp. CG24A]
MIVDTGVSFSRIAHLDALESRVVQVRSFPEESTMPVVHKSTVRRARQSVKRHARNHAALGALKSLVKKVQTAVTEKKVEDAKASLRLATSALGKAVTKGVMKPNTASRRIARLTLRVNSLSASAS